MLRKCVVLNLSVLVLSGSGLWAALPRCIPPAEGVGGTVLWQSPPNWWNPGLGIPRYDTRVDAPTWHGATAQSHPFGGTGTVEDMQFRALHRAEGGIEYLYLSWTAKAVPDLNSLGKNLVWFGLQNTAGGATGVAIKVQFDHNTDETAALPPAYITQVRVFDGTNWVPYQPPSPGPANPPTWIFRQNGVANDATENTARVWIDDGIGPGSVGSKRWTVSIRVPMSATATNSNLDSGVNIGSQFKFWYELRISTPSQTNGFVPYKWPVGIPDMDPLTDAPRPPSEWDTFRLSNAGRSDPPDPACLSDGVSIRPEDIGSDHPWGSSYISLATANTIHARPRNATGGTVNGIKARFRVGNFGNGATYEDVPNPTTTLWQDIADPNGVPAGGVSITGTQGDITTSYAVTAQCEKCRYRVYYNANKSACDTACSATTNDTRNTHQCVLVDLTGVGVNFTTASAFRNMDYATTSTFSEPAEINIKDLPGLAGGRDVYLYLEARNMPARTKAGTSGIGHLPIPDWPPPDQGAAVKTPPSQPSRGAGGHDAAGAVATDEQPPVVLTRSQQLISALNLALAQNQIDYDGLAQSMPTVMVHAYYDTGLRNTAGGGSLAILRPLTSFGYFVVHDGDVGGWNYSLQGAQLIAPNWYKVAVGASGLATVTTVVESLPPVRPIPWVLILIALVVLLLILVAYLWSKVHP